MPSPVESTKYGPPMPTNALTLPAPIFSAVRSAVPPVPVSGTSCSVAPFSNATPPEMCTNSSIATMM